MILVAGTKGGPIRCGKRPYGWDTGFKNSSPPKVLKYFLCLLARTFNALNVKKSILILIISVGFITGSFAQSPGFGHFNLGIDGAVPLYNMRAIFNNPGIGGSLKYEYGFNNRAFLKEKALNHFNFLNRLYVNISAGYESFSVKTPLQNAYVPSTYSYVPIKLGIKYYAYKGLYAEEQAGEVIYTQHGGGNNNENAHGIGYTFHAGFEIGVRYEYWRQVPENHITGDYGQSGPFATITSFRQFAIRLAERF